MVSTSYTHKQYETKKVQFFKTVPQNASKSEKQFLLTKKQLMIG